jgi:hypothetical protein
MLTVKGNNRFATREPSEPLEGEASVWWSWQAPSSQTYTMSAVGLGYFPPALGIFTGDTVSNLSLVTNGLPGAATPYAAQVELNATAGSVYSIAISAQMGAGGDCVLCIAPKGSALEHSAFTSIDLIGPEKVRVYFRTGGSNACQIEKRQNGSLWMPISLKYPSNCVLDFEDSIPDLSWGFYRLVSSP